MDDRENIYFAKDDVENIGDEIITRFDAFMEKLQSSGLLRSWVKRCNWYYGRFSDEDRFNSFSLMPNGIEAAGEDGELLRADVNHFRSILNNIRSMVEQNHPVFDVRSINTDQSSNQLASLGKTIIDHYMNKENVGRKLFKAVEHCLIFDRSFIHAIWDPQAGKQFGETLNLTTGEKELKGDVKVSVPLSCDVAYDPYIDEWDKHKWFIIRDYENRWDLIDVFPEWEEHIRGADIDDDNSTYVSSRLRHDGDGGFFNDNIEVFTFYHTRTPTLPEGRYVRCLRDGSVLEEGPLVYDDIPLVSMVPDEMIGTSFGFSPANNLLALQEAYNMMTGAMMTKIDATQFGIIALPHDSQFRENSIGDGIIYIDVPQGGTVPQAVNITNLPKEIFDLRHTVAQEMGYITGITQTNRGMGASGATGSSKAMDASITAANQGPFQQNYAKFAGDTATLILRMLRVFAFDERRLSIMGKYNSAKTAFSKGDLEDFDTVVCELGNPMTRTYQGRVSMAESLAAAQLIDADTFIEVLNTGNIDVAIEESRERKEGMRYENELLLEGYPVQVHPAEDHEQHIKEHRRLLYLPEFKTPKNQADINRLANWQRHYEEHLAELQRAQQMAMASMAAANAAPPVAPQAPPPSNDSPISPTNPSVQKANREGVEMPAMPRNPQSGKDATALG